MYKKPKNLYILHQSLTKHKLGRNIYFVNDSLFDLFVKK